MTKRPRSSVTTLLIRRVGVDRVSAITHTPASGPRAPVTTPPMSSASIAGAPAFGCCPDVTMTNDAIRAPAAPSVMVAHRRRPNMISDIIPSSKDADTTPTGLEVAPRGHLMKKTFAAVVVIALIGLILPTGARAE